MSFPTGRAKSILSTLNEVQRKAALHEEGPLVVFAGAGSGKTRIIASRVALLIEKGVQPHEIYAVTFTNKASNEMKERLAAMSPKGAMVHVGTFHSSCARWLREFAQELGFTSDFTIYDDKDSTTAIKKVMKEMNVKAEAEVTPAEFKSAIGKAKTYGWSPLEAEKQFEMYGALFPPMAAAVYKRYQEILAEANAMDFGDLLMNMLFLLRRNKHVRTIMNTRYKYVLVDEYQDTNATQFELISHLVEQHKNLFVVGDDDQSIYSWRGANPANILKFSEHYPGAEVVHLEQNYRCTGNIVNAASELILHNKTRAEKTLWTDNPAGELIHYARVEDGELEAWQVVESILREQDRFPYESVAIFYRTNAQSRQMENALRRDNIPYRIYGSLRFYDRAEVKDILCYFRLLVNEKDDVAFYRVINTPTRGIGAKAVDRIAARAKKDGISMLDACRLMVDERVPRLSIKLNAFLELYQSLRRIVEMNALADVVPHMLEYIGYTEYLEKKFPDQVVEKLGNVHELAAALADFEEKNPDKSLSDWLQDISLLGSEEQSEGGVTLMTLHSAKGLEFDRVYIVGVEDGLIPHSNSMQDRDQLEEERRLLYVGITRAKVQLDMLSASKRRTYDKWVGNNPSRFLIEIPAKYFDKDPNKCVQEYYMDGVYEEDESSLEEVAVGAYVSHPTYGRGVVVDVLEEFGQEKAVVNFSEFGKRKISSHHLESAETSYDYDI